MWSPGFKGLDVPIRIKWNHSLVHRSNFRQMPFLTSLAIPDRDSGKCTRVRQITLCHVIHWLWLFFILQIRIIAISEVHVANKQSMQMWQISFTAYTVTTSVPLIRIQTQYINCLHRICQLETLSTTVGKEAKTQADVTTNHHHKLLTTCSPNWPIVSGDHSRLGLILQRSPKEDLWDVLDAGCLSRCLTNSVKASMG